MSDPPPKPGGFLLGWGSHKIRVVGYGQVAQLVEHATENRSVGGSIPSLATRAVYGSSSIGRAPVSKTGGWGFDSLLPCFLESTRPVRLVA
jgi:hypothetical protein